MVCCALRRKRWQSMAAGPPQLLQVGSGNRDVIDLLESAAKSVAGRIAQSAALRIIP
jgi:hypothetical protein